MKRCNVVIEWSDGVTVNCDKYVMDDGDECYLHKKYFEKLTEPCYTDIEVPFVFRTHITAIHSPTRDEVLHYYHSEE